MLIYAITILLSAFLLFQVQPMLAKYILPWFGGTPAVWTTCVLFFQTLLLAGYAYAHMLTTKLGHRRQAISHISIISISLLIMTLLAFRWQSPITPDGAWKPQSVNHPAFNILLLLLSSVGLPYFLLSTTGPLLQSWFARTRPGVSPYRLYALSNFGSLFALVTYPFVVEPALTLRTQARAWSLGYSVFACGIALCALGVGRRSCVPLNATSAETSDDPARPSSGTRALWIALPACASVMLLASTNQICQEVAVIPFLWILPLVLYLLSFVICFDNERWYRRTIFHPALLLSLLGITYTLYGSNKMPLALQIAAYSFLLFAICMVCHGELVRLKPATRYLTAFYLMVALGGALGGIFVGLVAPHIFKGFWEFYLGAWAAPALLVVVLWREKDSWLRKRSPAIALALAVFAVLLLEAVNRALSTPARKIGPVNVRFIGMVILILLWLAIFRKRDSGLMARRPALATQLCALLALAVLGSMLYGSVHAQLAGSLIAGRNFYGSLRVVRHDAGSRDERYVLSNGRILHGLQFTNPDLRIIPTSYYGVSSGIGVLLRSYPNVRGLRVGVVGLGIGTIAEYGHAGDYLRFYEINPEVIRIASDPNGYFKYLRDCNAHVEIIPGDARLSMESEVESGNSQGFDVLAIDAFTSDSIPVHLLTREAFNIYIRQMKPGGVLAVHISNRYLDLRPVLWRLAEEYKLNFAYIHSSNQPPVNSMSDWVLLTRDQSVFSKPEIARAIVPHTEFTEPPLWTDNYSNLFEIVRHDQFRGQTSR